MQRTIGTSVTTNVRIARGCCPRATHFCGCGLSPLSILDWGSLSMSYAYSWPSPRSVTLTSKRPFVLSCLYESVEGEKRGSSSMTWPASQFLKLLSNRAFSHDSDAQGFHHLYLRGSLVFPTASADEAVNCFPVKARRYCYSTWSSRYPFLEHIC